MSMAQKLIELVRSIGNDVKLLTQRVDDAGALPVGSAGQVLKHNGAGWVAGTDNDTTYAVMPEAEMQTGASAGARTLSAVLLKAAIVYHGLKLGSTAGTAKAGDWKPAWSDVENKPTVIAAGTTAELARQAIGAGTSSLTIGTTSSTAAAGDHTHAGLMTQAERSKLASIQEGATAFALPAGVSGQVLKHNGTEWVAGTDNNTTYSTITNAEATAGTSTASRLVTPARLKLAIEAHAVPTATGQALEQRVSQLEASSSSGGITRARAQAIALCF